MIQQIRQAIPHPGRTGSLRHLRIRAEDVRPGVLHALHIWGMAIWFLVFPDKTRRPERPFPALDRLYRQTARDMRRVLAGWLNPWIPTPRCAFVTMNESSCYKEDRHQIWIHKRDHFLLQLLDCYTYTLEALLSLSEPQVDQARSWEQVLSPMQMQVAKLKHVYGDLEQHPYLRALHQEWAPLEQELLEACRRWEHQPNIEEVKHYYQAVSELQKVLWKRMRMILIHELTHAWARRKLRHAQNIWYFQTGVQRFDREHVLAHLARPGRLYLHWAMNEAIVDWIALRIYQDEPLLVWRQVILPTGYAYWLTNDMAEALNAFWERVTAAIPALPRRFIRNPEELLYTIHFRDPGASIWLEQGLAVACGGLHAFALLSQACERFTLGRGAKTPVEVEQLKESFTNLQLLLGPALTSSERSIPFPFWDALGSEFAHRLSSPIRSGTVPTSHISLSY